MILLVEDEAPARYAFARILRNQGHVVMEAADGLEALDVLEKYHFNLVITDLVMPNLNGFHLVARIRGKWPDTPILIMSAYFSEAAGQVLLEGKSEFIQKPIDSSVLLATVQRLLVSLSGS
ncbi:MAG: response regulator [Deltaproteobacteria bacterium]|jgi:CheY-like chemotaxis protein|nr:MAG: response regulator [Deltaproteobacteria bacterium]